MSFKDKICSRAFVLTSEIGPPKGIETSTILEDAELIRGRVDAINVTDLQSSVMRLGSLAVCSCSSKAALTPFTSLPAGTATAWHCNPTSFPQQH